MDFWESIILQWLNCLYSEKEVESLEQLKDGKIYYDLINQIKPWNGKNYHDRYFKIVLKFVEDEYPNFIMSDKNDTIENLCFASLILARLSLEPIFHKSLCSNLDVDAQIKIKLILESIYSLGKNITAQDICKVFSLPSDSDSSFCTPTFQIKSKLILKEFLNSPATRSAQNDKKIHDQNRQLRNLRADLETVHYEKSELIEDIKNRDKKIKELQQELQKTSSELKSLKADFSKNSFNLSYEEQSLKSLDALYKEERESLEKYVTELQNDNLKLQDEKNNLLDEITNYKTRCCKLEEKSNNNEQIIETLSFQIEKKDEELMELKIKYEELNNYLKEKSKIFLGNQSFEIDDKISEISMNKSETLSSVIEVQLLDTKKEIVNLQNQYNTINTLLTIFMEEYKKLKYKMIFIAGKKNEAINEKLPNSLEMNDLCSVEHDNITDYQIIVKHVNPEILQELKNNNKMSLLLDLLKISTECKSAKSLRNYVSLQNYEKQVANTKIKPLPENEKATIKFVDENKHRLKFYDSLHQLNCHNQLSIILKSFLKEIMTGVLELSNENEIFYQFIGKKPVFDHNFTKNNVTMVLKNIVKNELKNQIVDLDTAQCSSLTIVNNDFTLKNKILSFLTQKEINIARTLLNTIIKDSIIENLKLLQTHSKTDDSLLIEKLDVDFLKSSWSSLSNYILNSIKIYKVLLLLDKSWKLTLESFTAILNKNHCDQPKLKNLFEERNKIEVEIKDILSDNLRILSHNLIIGVQFLIKLSEYCTSDLKCQETFKDETALIENFNNLMHPVPNTNLEAEKSNIPMQANFSKRISELKRRIDDFKVLMNTYEKEIDSIIESNNSQKNVKLSTENEKNTDEKSSNENTVDINQTQNHIKEIHEKYELKLEKMKEKMKAVYNNQITAMKKEQESVVVSKIEALEKKLEKQCLNHTEELKKYKKHISELTTQLWDVGEKLINEKQKKEDFHHKFKDLKTKYDNIELQNSKTINNDLENSFIKPEKNRRALQLPETSFSNKLHNVKGFQMIGNAFKNEDEEGEVFDQTYLSDLQRPRESLSSLDLNRLSILQMRNAKCKPHLKSSYPAETNFHPVPLSEDEIKNGNNAEEFLNDSLSQSLLTGKKVKRKDRSKNASETPKVRRFSNIFRKPRSSTEDRQSKMT